MPEDVGLLGIGEYTGREAAPISHTTQSTISTAPASQADPGAAAPPAYAPSPPPAAVPSPPAVPPEPVRPEESKTDLIGDMSKAFAKSIGEAPPEVQTPQPPAEAPKPPEKTWRDVEPPATATKKVQEDWRTFKEKAKADIDARDSRIKALESELETSKNQLPTHQAQLEEAKKQAQDAMSVVERVAIERSPLFKSKVLDQEALLKARLGQLVEGTGITPQEGHAILYGDLNTRERVIESRQISTFRRQQIADTLARWDNVEEERSKLLERGRETLQVYLKEQQQAQESARAQFMREAEKTFEDQFALCKSKLEVYNHIEGNEKWNQCCDALKTTARNLYSGSVSRELVAQAAILAPAAVAYQNLLRHAYGEIQELRNQVAKLQGVQPGVRDTGGDVMQPAQALSSPNGDFVKDMVLKFQRVTGVQ